MQKVVLRAGYGRFRACTTRPFPFFASSWCVCSPPLLSSRSTDASSSAKTILALAASRESYREGTSKTPLYSDSFYMTVTQAVITAKVVTTDLERTKELIKQFYQRDQPGS